MALVAKDAAAYTMPTDKLVAMSNRELCDKAQAHWDKNELDSALICFNIVANRADNKQSQEEMNIVVRATIAMASIYEGDFYDYERAMQCLLKSEQIAKKHQFGLSSIYELMATLLYDKNSILHDFAFDNESFELHRKAFRLSIEERESYQAVLSLVNMITIASRHHKLDIIKNELELFSETSIGDSIRASSFAKQLCSAAIHQLHNDNESAITELIELEHCLDMIEHNQPIYRIVAHQILFYVYCNVNDYDAAFGELNTMEKIALENGRKDAIIEILLHKRDFYSELGNSSLANKYDLQYHKAKDEFMAEAKVAKVDEERVLFKLNEANHEIKELYYKQHIQQTELIAVAVVAVLLLALLVLAWLSHRRTKQKNQSLYDRNQQLLTHVDRLRQIRKEQEQQAQETQTISTTTIKYGRGKMEHNDIAQVMEKVERAMDTSPEIFSTDFSLDQLVELTGESRPRLSQALNEVPDRSFYSILNEYRVREACRRMNDKEHYGDLTIEAVGQSVGFKSRSNFVSTFKRIVGLTPSAYLKQPSKTKELPDETKQDIST